MPLGRLETRYATESTETYIGAALVLSYLSTLDDGVLIGILDVGTNRDRTYQWMYCYGGEIENFGRHGGPESAARYLAGCGGC